MHRIETVLAILERSLDNPKKRHIAGGILLSVSVLFGSLAATILTLQSEE